MDLVERWVVFASMWGAMDRVVGCKFQVKAVQHVVEWWSV